MVARRHYGRPTGTIERDGRGGERGECGQCDCRAGRLQATSIITFARRLRTRHSILLSMCVFCVRVAREREREREFRAGESFGVRIWSWPVIWSRHSLRARLLEAEPRLSAGHSRHKLAAVNCCRFCGSARRSAMSLAGRVSLTLRATRSRVDADETGRRRERRAESVFVFAFGLFVCAPVERSHSGQTVASGRL